MSDLISGVISIRTLLEKKESIIGYAESGQLKEWTLKENRIYCIPGYQREIKWNPENLQILFEDLMEDSRFLGNILLSTSNLVRYDVIDGQQRLSALFMLLKRIESNKENDLDIDTCEYVNETFPRFIDALEKNFMFSEEEEKDFSESDVLKQRDTLYKLWDCVCKNVDILSEYELVALEENILDSTISVLISNIIDPSKKKSRRVCVDYFIDINNKSVNLDCVDILKAYAFREDFDSASEKWIQIQKNIRKSDGIVYPQESLFYHYFLCTINQNLEYSVRGLSEQYKVSKQDVAYDNKIYLTGTDIEILLSKTPNYYRKMLDRIIKYQEFILIVRRDKMTPSEEFCEYFKCNTKVDFTTIQNSFMIINGILRNSDVVPKLLVMKYFLDVLLDINKTKEDIKLIYWINVLATFFSASKTTRKSTDSFSGILLKSNWKKLVEKRAKLELNKFPKQIGFSKIIYQDKQATSTSGQYLARRLHGITASFVQINDKWNYNERTYEQVMNSTGTFNDEHFLINRSGKIKVVYGNSAKEIIIDLPKPIKNKMSYIGNYLVINQTINSNMQNMNIYDKICYLEEEIKTGRKDIFADVLSEFLFMQIKNCFKEKGLLLNNKLVSIEDSKGVEAEVNRYYEEDFQEDYALYAQQIYLEGESSILFSGN